MAPLGPEKPPSHMPPKPVDGRKPPEVSRDVDQLSFRRSLCCWHLSLTFGLQTPDNPSLLLILGALLCTPGASPAVLGSEPPSSPGLPLPTLWLQGKPPHHEGGAWSCKGLPEWVLEGVWGDCGAPPWAVGSDYRGHCSGRLRRCGQGSAARKGAGGCWACTRVHARLHFHVHACAHVHVLRRLRGYRETQGGPPAGNWSLSTPGPSSLPSRVFGNLP